MPPGTLEPLQSPVDASLDYNPISYRDPTADSAIRHLMAGQYQITHESGLRFWIDSDTLASLLRQCDAIEAKRSGRIHLRLKRDTPDALQGTEGNTSETLTTKQGTNE